jgi:hypothetical protein
VGGGSQRGAQNCLGETRGGCTHTVGGNGSVVVVFVLFFVFFFGVFVVIISEQ